MKDSFLIFTDNLDVVSELSDSEAGVLLKAIAQYVTTGTTPELPKLVKVVFTPIKNSIDRNNKKYIDVVEKRKQAGKMGGQAKASKSKQVLASASKTKQRVTNLADSDPDPVPDPEPVSDINILFDQFWNSYPKKEGKVKCLQKYARIYQQHDEIMKGLNNYLVYINGLKSAQKKDPKRFVPPFKNPLTFLMGEHWKDEYDKDFQEKQKTRDKIDAFEKVQAEKKAADELFSQWLAKAMNESFGEGNWGFRDVSREVRAEVTDLFKQSYPSEYELIFNE